MALFSRSCYIFIASGGKNGLRLFEPKTICLSSTTARTLRSVTFFRYARFPMRINIMLSFFGFYQVAQMIVYNPTFSFLRLAILQNLLSVTASISTFSP